MTTMPMPAAGTSTRHGTPWLEARDRARGLGAGRPTTTTRISIAEAAGLTLREPVRALLALPPHAASAMDGWVVAGDPPWSVGDPIDAGHEPDRTALPSGTARPICTGAPVPPGARGILRLENGEVVARGGRPELHRAPNARPDEPRPGEHIRPAGEEAAAGELLIARGSVLTPPRIALCAASGHDQLHVAMPPSVDLLVLGNELSSSGVPRPGAIRDIVSPSFPAMLAALGAAVQRIERCGEQAGECKTDHTDRNVRILDTGIEKQPVQYHYDACEADGNDLFKGEFCQHLFPSEKDVQCNDSEKKPVPDKHSFVERDQFS